MFPEFCIIKENDHSVGASGPVAPTHILQSNSLGSIIGQFKLVVTKKIRKTGLADFKWQRNYYEHIIRNERELQKIHEYIIHNPLKWEEDRENPRQN